MHTHTHTYTQTPLDEPALQKAISYLGSAEVRSSCQQFILPLRTLETDLRDVAEQISVIKIPQVPDLERVHSIIDQCQVCLACGHHPSGSAHLLPYLHRKKICT